MKKERQLVVKTKTKDNTKELVLLEDGEIVEYKKESATLVGNIYCGRVMDVVENINASFIDIGEERNAFIKSTDYEVGEFVLVQLASGQHHDKGASLSRNISFVGRFCILIVNPKGKASDLRLSTKIVDEEAKEILVSFGNKLLQENNDSRYRLIIRSDSQGIDLNNLEKEFLAFIEEFKEIEKACRQVSGNPILLKENEGIIAEMIDHYSMSSFKKIYTDDPKLSILLSRRYPNVDVQTIIGKNDLCILDILNLSSSLVRLLSKKVWLKSGAYILIEVTEALTVIDVNSGRFKDSQAFAVNKEAAKEIMRQLRLRNIGGIIVCDFIDMKSGEDDNILLEYMRELARDDFQKPIIVDITKLGLVEMTRRRIES